MNARWIPAGLLAGALGLLSGTAATADGTEFPDLPDAPGKLETVAACSQCHGLGSFMDPRPAGEWSQIVTLMIGNGMSVTDEEYQLIMTYLTTNLVPPDAAPQPGIEGAAEGQ